MTTITVRFATFALGALAAAACSDGGASSTGPGADGGAGASGSAGTGAGAGAGGAAGGGGSSGTGSSGGSGSTGSGGGSGGTGGWGASGGAPACGDFTLPALATTEIGSFSRPVHLTHAPGDDAVFVVEARGSIQRVTSGGTNEFLNLRSVIGGTPTDGDERGLLGLAFHPDYATNGRFFVAYTPLSQGKNIVAEYRRDPSDPTHATATEVARLLDLDDDAGNHNGGMIAFGPDGMLYVGTGDGGGSGDPDNHALDLGSLFGKLLRLDPDAASSGYAATGNPFSGGTGLPQIWSYGLRNPWRFSFDRATGDLFLGDVGQGEWEEVDFQPSTSTGGENWGWRAYEGNAVYRASDVSSVPLHSAPIYAYRQDGTEGLLGGCAVTGGYVYRGSALPALQGVYFFGDYCSQQVVAFRYCEGALHGARVVGALSDLGLVASFGEDAAGELYVVTLQGPVLRVGPG